MRRAILVIFGVAGLSCGDDADDECGVATSFTIGPTEVRGPTMRAGANCLRCHSAGGQASNKPFAFGGTIFASADADLCGGVAGVTIRVTDGTGKTVSVVSNEVGNFWSAEPLALPYRMSAEREGRVLTMPIEAPTGGCALCHSSPDAQSGAKGRIRAP